LRVCLATNGTLVNDEICKKLKDVDIKMVSLSLDGHNEKFMMIFVSKRCFSGNN